MFCNRNKFGRFEKLRIFNFVQICPVFKKIPQMGNEATTLTPQPGSIPKGQWAGMIPCCIGEENGIGYVLLAGKATTNELQTLQNSQSTLPLHLMLVVGILCG
jgi:hypothetical protein